MTVSRFVDDPRFVRKYDVRVAAEIGDRAATFIQQVHYHVLWRQEKWNSSEYRASLSEWEATFPFWGRETVKRIIKQCKTLGVLKVRKGLFQGRNAIWYSINHERLDQIGDAGAKKLVHMAQNEHSTRIKMSTLHGSKRALYMDQNEQHLIIQNTNTTTAKNNNRSGAKKAPRVGLSVERLKQIKQKNYEKIHSQFVKKRTPASFARMWEMMLVERFTKSGYTPLSVADAKNLKDHFFKWCDDAGLDAMEFVEWCIDEWQYLRSGALKWAKLGEYPQFGRIYALKDHFLEAKRAKGGTARREKTKVEIFTDMKQVPADHPLYHEIELLIKHTGKAVIK